VSGFGSRSNAVSEHFDLYTGNANPELARKIATYLGRELGRAEVFEFANENIFVKIEDNARDRDVFIIQPTCRPVQKSIMELLIMIDAFKRASAGRITAVVPYYAYGRSDKKDQPRVPITARLIADMISVAGADRMLTMDLHQGQIQGFFSIPVDELEPLQEAQPRGPGGGDRPRLRQACPDLCRDPRSSTRHHRKAPPRQSRHSRAAQRHR
jgi:ribose-phosphate pyrophosphokinase